METFETLIKSLLIILPVVWAFLKILFGQTGTEPQREKQDKSKTIEWDTKAKQIQSAKNDVNAYKKRLLGVKSDKLDYIETLKDVNGSLNRIMTEYQFKEKEDYENLKAEYEYLINTEFPDTHTHQYNKGKRLEALIGIAEKEKISPLEKAKS